MLINYNITHWLGDKFKFERSNALSSISESSNKFLELTVDSIPSSDLWIILKRKMEKYDLTISNVKEIINFNFFHIHK